MEDYETQLDAFMAHRRPEGRGKRLLLWLLGAVLTVPAILGRSYWIPGAWNVRTSYTDELPFWCLLHSMG